MTLESQQFYFLGAALAIGLLIGLERGWQERERGEGARIAGVRTFALLGLLGGVVALLGQQYGELVIGFAFVGVAGLLTAVYVANRSAQSDAGITGEVTGLLTLALGMLAGAGNVALAAGFAVLSVLLLGNKPTLHRWLRGLEARELRAAYTLLLISVVMLPVLPNQGYGPWQTLNPYQIWWMVVLIAAISFTGYFAIKIGGARRGALFTGLFGGLASSTALTLHFSRLAREQGSLASPLATGVLIACGTMYPRMLLVACLINPALFDHLLLPTCVMTVLVFAAAALVARRGHDGGHQPGAQLNNPLRLITAIGFGLLLAAVMLLGKALQAWLGESGVLLLAAASGVADVDAINLSLAGMSRDVLSPTLASAGIVIAACVNSVVKGGIAVAVGGRSMGRQVAVPLALAALAGSVTAAMLLY